MPLVTCHGDDYITLQKMNKHIESNIIMNGLVYLVYNQTSVCILKYFPVYDLCRRKIQNFYQAHIRSACYKLMSGPHEKSFKDLTSELRPKITKKIHAILFCIKS